MMQKQDAECQRMKRAQVVATGMLVLVALTLLGLAGRVAWLERNVSADQIRQLAQQHTAVISLMPTRGSIYFADGTEAATSIRMYNMFVDPSYLMDTSGRTLQRTKYEEEKAELAADDPRAAVIREKLARLSDLTKEEREKLDQGRKALAKQIALLLKVDPANLEKEAAKIEFNIEDNVFYKKEVQPGVFKNTDEPRRFMWLQKEVDEKFHDDFLARKAKLKELAKAKEDQARTRQEKEDIRDAKLLAELRILDGVGFVKSMRRVYPLGSLAGHIIGLANVDGGTDALEYQLNPLLAGRPGRMVVMKDAQRRTLDAIGEQYVAPDDGRAVWLTIDPMIQAIAEEELRVNCEKFHAESGCAILMDPKTGKILAMASYPPFDPSKPGTELAARLNHNIAAPYEPGSIFKPFIMAWALDKGLVKSTDIFNGGSGYWTDPTGRVVRDTHACGPCTPAEVIIKSSNVCMAQLGWKIGNPALYDAVSNFGFNRRTGVELPGDQRGLVHPLSQWNSGTKTSVPFGYEVAVTPLQLVRAFGVFANDGKLVTPHVIGAVEATPGKATPWEEIAGKGEERQVIDPKTAKQMRDIMEGVFSPEGTAKGKQSALYRIFGKTGTAHLAIRGEGRYAGDQYNSSFLAGAPATDPKLVGIVTIHKPDKSVGHFGGTVAAPAAIRMMERVLVYQHVKPDQTPQGAAGAGGARNR
jgi:cell division protein FtsI (penicillin-binding protein 3)